MSHRGEGISDFILERKEEVLETAIKNELGTNMHMSVQIKLGDGGKAGPQTEVP